MALYPLAFDLAGIPDIQCPLRAVIEILDFVEAVTNTPFENLVIQDQNTSETAFPFRALLEFVEASCEHQLQGLVILDSEELRTYKTKLLQRVQESYSKHYDSFVRENSSPHLHHRIGQLQAELSTVYANLKDQQTELASLRSAQSKQIFKAYENPNNVDTESDSDLIFIPKRRRLSGRSNHFGTDGVDEQTIDDPMREPKPASSKPHDVSSMPYHTSRQRVSAPYSPRHHHSARSSPHRGRTSHHGAIETMSARGSTLAEYEYDSRAAVGSPNRSAFDGLLMPSPRQPRRTYAPALAMRKPKVDEYDPLGRLIEKDVYPLSNEKEDAAVTGTWTTIDPDENRRHWDALKQQERSQSDSYGSPSMSQKSNVNSHRDLWDRRNSSSGADFAKAINNRGWAISHDEAEMSVDPRFEDPELDVDPEVRSSFRDVTELLKPQNTPRSAFESRNKDALSRNTAGAVKVIIGGQVAKTLLRKVDHRAELRDRHGKYIDGQDRGLMKKHLEEDRRRLIKERDEQLVRATQEKRAWDAMDPSEKERRLAKKARNNFLIRMLGAGMGGTDMYETEEIPEVYTRKVSIRETAAWTARSTPLQFWSPAEDDDYPQPVQDDEVLFANSLSTQSIESHQSDKSSRTARPTAGFASSCIAGNVTDKAISTSSSTTKETRSSVLDKGPDLAPLVDITVDLVRHSDDSAAKKFDLTRAASSQRGRVVSVTLHEPVVYSTSAVVERVFGGTVQEIQFFPEERQALVVFVHPDEAATFVKHVQSVKETESRDYRQLQLDASWYKEIEATAIWPAQTLILAAVIAGEASRSILLRGLSPELSLDELSRQMKVRLSKILVKVTLVKQRNAFTRKREGNSAVLELASIRDAVDVIQLFESKKVADFTQVTTEVLTDPCCKGPAITRDYCRCIYCYRSRGSI